MGKRVDHDATQEVSGSMLVPDAKGPAKPPGLPGVGNVPKNDASMWLSAPVSADDFVSAPRKPVAPRSSRGIFVGLIAAFVVAGIGGGVWYFFFGPGKAQPQSSASFGTKPAQPAVPPTLDAAAVATAPDDAGSGAAGAVADASDAGVAAGALVVDAVSGADPAAKKAKKRPAKKRATKKKAATGAKKKKR